MKLGGQCRSRATARPVNGGGSEVGGWVRAEEEVTFFGGIFWKFFCGEGFQTNLRQTREWLDLYRIHTLAEGAESP